MQQPHSHIQPAGGVSAGTLRLLDLFRTGGAGPDQNDHQVSRPAFISFPVWRNQNQPTRNLSVMLEQRHSFGLT